MRFLFLCFFILGLTSSAHAQLSLEDLGMSDEATTAFQDKN